MSRKLIFFTFLLFFILISLTAYSFYQADKQNRSLQSDARVQKLREQIDFMKKEALAVALAISKNPTVTKSLRQNNPELVSNDLKSLLSSYSQAGNEVYRIQIHTPQKKLFFRSWEFGAYGEDLSHRKGITKVIQYKKPIVSVELGKELNIKAVVPVFDKNEYIGSLEVIKSFDSMVERFKQENLSLVILLDEFYKKQAVGLANNDVTNGFIIAQREYDKEMVSQFGRINFFLFLHNVSAKTDKYDITSEPLIDVDGKRIGFFVVGSQKGSFINNDGLSFYLTFSKKEIALLHQPKNRYNEIDARSMLDRYESADKNDREFIRRELEVLFKDKSSDEIVKIILENGAQPKVGEIR